MQSLVSVLRKAAVQRDRPQLYTNSTEIRMQMQGDRDWLGSEMVETCHVAVEHIQAVLWLDEVDQEGDYTYHLLLGPKVGAVYSKCPPEQWLKGMFAYDDLHPTYRRPRHDSWNHLDLVTDSRVRAAYRSSMGGAYRKDWHVALVTRAVSVVARSVQYHDRCLVQFRDGGRLRLVVDMPFPEFEKLVFDPIP